MRKIAIGGQQCAGKSSIASILCNNHYKESTTRIIKFADPIYTAIDGLGKQKHRKFMQEYGDLAKKHFGEHVFLERFLNETEKSDADVLICDDMRFDFEVDALIENGWDIMFVGADTHIRQKRAEEQGIELNDNHNSEAFVDYIREKSDYQIINNGCIDELFQELEEIYGNY
jgi:dephospho-CoA kinase